LKGKEKAGIDSSISHITSHLRKKKKNRLEFFDKLVERSRSRARVA
jgi:hypothetical protein